MDFNIIWRFFSWTNQALAMIVLWTGAVYLARTLPNKSYSLLAAVPATFMSAVSVTYILQAPEGLKLSTGISYPAGIVAAVVFAALYYKALAHGKPAASN